MRILKIAFLIVFALASTASAQETAEKLFEKVQVHYDKNEFTNSLEISERGIALFPKDGRFYTAKIANLIGLDLNEKALAALKQRTAAFPSAFSESTLYLGAFVNGRLGNLKIAAADAFVLVQKWKDTDGNYAQLVDDLIASDPKLIDAWQAKARLCHNKGDFLTAISSYSKVLELGPRSGDTYLTALLNRAVSYERTKQWEKALSDYTEIVLTDPENYVKYYGYRGRVYFNMGKFDQALADVDKALTKLRFLEFYNIRGDIYLKQGKTDPAIEAFRESVKDTPQNDEIPAFEYARAALKRLKVPEIPLPSKLGDPETYWETMSADGKNVTIELNFDDEDSRHQISFENRSLKGNDPNYLEGWGKYELVGSKFTVVFRMEEDKGNFKIEGEILMSAELKPVLRITSLSAPAGLPGTLRVGQELRLTKLGYDEIPK